METPSNRPPAPEAFAACEWGCTPTNMWRYCETHSAHLCRGCANPTRGDVSRGDLSRHCPIHGVVADEARYWRRQEPTGNDA
jgi:hypothetical protein